MQCKEETAEMETQRKNVHAETLHADETPPLKDFEQKNERADHLQEPAKDDSNGEAPIWEHIGELRQRLLKCVAAVVVCFACLMYVGPQRIMDLVTAPVKKEGVQFIYLGLAGVVMAAVGVRAPGALSGRKEAGAGMDVSVPVPFCFGGNLWLRCGIFFCSQLFCICGSRYGAAVAGP